MKLEDAWILVTGGAVRLGRAICEELASNGARVLIHYRSSSDEAEALAESLRMRGGQADTVSGALDTEIGCADVLNQAIQHGTLRGLVNCAAAYERHLLEESDEAAMLSQLRPNLFAPLALTRGFAAQADAGVVINLLDRRIAAHDEKAIPYQLSKVALAELTRLAALELAPGIRVNAVAPGPVLPPPGLEDSDYLLHQAGKTPLGQVCDPAAVARAVIFLMKEPAITGQIVFVDGGQHLLGNGV